MAKTKIDKLERLRAEATERDTRLKALGRDAGLAWAPEAGASALKRLAAAAGRSHTVRGYLYECARDPLGLAARLYLDINDSSPGTFMEWEELTSFWSSVLWGEDEAIRDPNVAEAFVAAALEVWDDAQSGC